MRALDPFHQLDHAGVDPGGHRIFAGGEPVQPPLLQVEQSRQLRAPKLVVGRRGDHGVERRLWVRQGQRRVQRREEDVGLGLDERHLATSQPPFSNEDDFAVEGATSSLGIALREAGAVRNLGPTSLQIAHVASGRLDAFWEYGEDTFNCLGGALPVTEAGGLATDVSGLPYRAASNSAVAAPGPVNRSLRAAFERPRQ